MTTTDFDAINLSTANERFFGGFGIRTVTEDDQRIYIGMQHPDYLSVVKSDTFVDPVLVLPPANAFQVGLTELRLVLSGPVGAIDTQLRIQRTGDPFFLSYQDPFIPSTGEQRLVNGIYRFILESNQFEAGNWRVVRVD
ncbi:MAG: hypothetical protein AAF196_16955 [Planctomycetota bacterium]